MVLDRDDCILLVIDIQERLMAAMGRAEETIAASGRLIEGCSALQVPMLVTEQYPKGLGPTVPSMRSKLPPGRFEKLSFNCCREEGFLESLAEHGMRQVLICGSEAHVCVLQTCMGLLEAGYNVHVASDAVCSRSDDDRDTAFQSMRQAGAVVSSTETALFQLLKAAGTEEFKTVSGLIR